MPLEADGSFYNVSHVTFGKTITINKPRKRREVNKTLRQVALERNSFRIQIPNIL